MHVLMEAGAGYPDGPVARSRGMGMSGNCDAGARIEVRHGRR